MIRNLFKQTSWYSLPFFIEAAIGFGTFAIWTRHFTLKEYGMMSLIDITLIFVAPLALVIGIIIYSAAILIIDNRMRERLRIVLKF